MVSARLTGGIKQQAWSGLCSAERLSRYYNALFSKFHKRQVSWRLTIAGIASLASLLIISGSIANTNTWLLVPGAFASFLAALAAWAGVANDDARYAVIARIASGRWQSTALEWQTLWYELDDLESTQALTRLNELRHSEALLEAEIDCGAHDYRLNEQCAEAAYTVLEQRFRPKHTTEA